MGLYLENGYINIAHLDRDPIPFSIITGGRGTGKTYSILKYYLEKGSPIIYMRRTDTQMKVSASPVTSPYKVICADMGIDLDIRKGVVQTFYRPDENVAAYFLALSTFANIRGFSADDCEAIVYDEFIPEIHARPIKDEGEALLNAYETVARNRELDGRPPLKMWLLSNTNNILSPVLKELGVLEIALKSERTKQVRVVDEKRGLQYINLWSSPISKRKRETALYRLAPTNFKEMALSNSYQMSTEIISSRNLREYRSLCRLGEVTIYKHKSNYEFYATFHHSGTCEEYGTSERELQRFAHKYGWLIDEYRLGYVIVENVDIYYILEELF